MSFLLRSLSDWHDKNSSISPTKNLNTPYLNSIQISEQPNYPGDLELEKRIENILRWNAMAMVLQGQDNGSGVGGHIATYASAATLMEVGFNHFFRKQSESYGGDLIIPQPHTSPDLCPFLYRRSFIRSPTEKFQAGIEKRRRAHLLPALRSMQIIGKLQMLPWGCQLHCNLSSSFRKIS